MDLAPERYRKQRYGNWVDDAIRVHTQFLLDEIMAVEIIHAPLMSAVLDGYFRLASDWTGHFVSETAVGEAGFFKFGSEILCYGICRAKVLARTERTVQYDAMKDVCFDDSNVYLPFDPAEVIENLYRERYELNLRSVFEGLVMGHRSVRKIYYALRGALPTPLRRCIQRAYFSGWEGRIFPAWPLDCTVDLLHQQLLKLAMEARRVRRVPFIWFWPEGASSCLIMTHDVETAAGRDYTGRLMDIDESYGFKSSFQVIPEKRYTIDEEYVETIRRRGFEFNVHDLNHDGHLYEERGNFLSRAKRINEYVRRFNARGFRAGSMYRNADWYDAFEFSYDMSMPNVAHFEPKRGGCCTVMPFFIGKVLELPLTTIQDYSLFHILKNYSLDLWKTQTALIQQKNGLISFTTHPDYLMTSRERRIYESLLCYLQGIIARDNIWAPLPGEVDSWWRARNEMKLICRDGVWKIHGRGHERARIAYAVLDGDRLVYELN